MAIHGVRRVGGDIDLVAHPELFARLAESLELPNGTPLRHKHRGRDDVRLLSRRSVGEHRLGVDIVSFVDLPGDRPLKAFEWYARIAEQYPYSRGIIYYASLEQIKIEKASSLRVKDRLDLRRISKHLEIASAVELIAL